MEELKNPSSWNSEERVLFSGFDIKTGCNWSTIVCLIDKATNFVVGFVILGGIREFPVVEIYVNTHYVIYKRTW